FTQIFTPTEFTEFTEQTGREYYPTDFTDLHRYLLPQNSRNSQNRLAKNILTQISQIYTDIYSHRIREIQNRLAENIIPQISRIYTDVSKMFCVFREICGSFFSAINFRLPGGALVSSAPTY
ncbi:hypothetical protein, partial [Leyella stercorea]|uniref:hypothetical protein n=1 Tax=Leyella stercorea TaxID=363265 RepID=UPI00242DE666